MAQGGENGGAHENICGILAVLGAGLGGLCRVDGDFGKVGVAQIGSDFATLIRTVVILAVIFAIVLVSGQWQPLASVSGKPIVLALSGLATGGSWLCYYRALKLGDAARVAPIDKLSVVLVAVFAVVFLEEQLSGPNWLGVCMIAAGAVLVSYRG